MGQRREVILAGAIVVAGIRQFNYSCVMLPSAGVSLLTVNNRLLLLTHNSLCGFLSVKFLLKRCG